MKFSLKGKILWIFFPYGIIFRMIKRYLEKYILGELKERMTFVGGPRQVGKTTLAGELAQKYYSKKFQYLNWDYRPDRRAILNFEFEAEKELYIFDEIHKYRGWKNYLKGFYDKYKGKIKIIVTGSSRLDIYRKGEDSLLGRYRYFRLHPLSLGELAGKELKPEIFKPIEFLNIDKQRKRIFEDLFTFGGFPEVFLKKDKVFLRRWHIERVDKIVKEEIRDIENIREISLMEALIELLPSRVSSLVSLNSLREDLEVSFKSVRLWMDILERFYYIFRIYPYSSRKIKSLKKEPKLYLWDWSEIEDEAKRFENMIACHLLKFVNFLYDIKGYKAQLYYLRDVEKREVDFLVIVDKKPWFCVEAKLSRGDFNRNIEYFSRKLKIPFSYQVVKKEGIDILKGNIRIINAVKFLTALG